MWYIECVECFEENFERFEKHKIKWNYPASFIHKGQSCCREHFIKKLREENDKRNHPEL